MNATLSAGHTSSVNDIGRHDAVKIHPLKAHEVADQNECALCELIVNSLKSLLEKNSTEVSPRSDCRRLQRFHVLSANQLQNK